MSMQMGPRNNTEAQVEVINYVRGICSMKQAISFEYASKTLIDSHNKQAMRLAQRRKEQEVLIGLSRWRKVLIRWLSKGSL